LDGAIPDQPVALVAVARAGTARSYVYDDRPVSRYDAIEAAEAEARSALRGLWGPPCNGNTESTRTVIAVSDRRVVLRRRSAVAAVAAVVAAATALALPPVTGADPEDCDETLILYDPHDLVLDTDVLVDFSTLIDVESLVDDYTEKIDEASTPSSTTWNRPMESVPTI
jgi:hypothetical protein